jgi:hypothetical protein
MSTYQISVISGAALLAEAAFSCFEQFVLNERNDAKFLPLFNAVLHFF